MKHEQPTCKTESDLFYRYLYFIFNPRACKHRLIGSDPMTGTLSWNVPIKKYDGHQYTALYATPCWEGSMNSIDIQLADDLGNFTTLSSISFPLNDWTMDVEQDFKRYVDAVTKEIRKYYIEFEI